MTVRLRWDLIVPKRRNLTIDKARFLWSNVGEFRMRLIVEPNGAVITDYVYGGWNHGE